MNEREIITGIDSQATGESLREQVIRKQIAWLLQMIDENEARIEELEALLCPSN